ncbi:hypothetical protein SAMN05421773_12062 [Streptomyces aidingensis]|uniref:Phage integrase family protein n=1 Tax=Streptomyces aidingensis TaxID=910347 RepID=A0A1I1TNE1_9ACTN|nr:hypothetical protein [Streptomyces aidingensis]SFD60161.1 hypothetical protein SAMN05421773_12062 [Streptomyces aidingensis]
MDLKRGTIRVERQRNQAAEICPPKTGKSRRTVPVGEVVTDVLLRHLAERPSKEWLFTMEEGAPLVYTRWRTEWKAARRAYAHLWPGEDDRTRSVMDAVLGGLRTGCGPKSPAEKETAGQRP